MDSSCSLANSDSSMMVTEDVIKGFLDPVLNEMQENIYKLGTFLIIFSYLDELGETANLGCDTLAASRLF